MRKEVLYAIVAGISIGLFFAFGAWKVSKIVKVTPAPVITNKTPIPTVITKLITVDGLKNYDVVNENPTIKGLASPNIDIIVSTEISDYYTKSNSSGEFEITVEIPTGMSQIKINEFKLILINSTEVEEGRTAYVGTITDISTGTIQVRGVNATILQISLNDQTSYVNTLKKNSEVKETDLAIGDYIIAMGVSSTNKVLTAERILIASPLVENTIMVEKILINKLTKTTINDIKLPAKWNGPNIKELEIGQEIYITGTKNNDKFDLRSIFVIE